MVCIFDGFTNIGGRENNEDAFLTSERNGDHLFVVADGLGGHDCGEVASGLAVETFGRLFSSSDAFNPAAAVKEADRLILEEQKKTGKKMRTTVALLYVHDNRATVVHTGDTRAYVFRDGRILWRTLDHSAAQLAVAAGEITPDQIRSHPDRNVLVKALGGSDNLRPDVTAFDCRPGDAFLLCSDGFWEYVVEEDMLKNLKYASKPEKWNKKMRAIREEKAPQDSDNNTAIAVFMKR